MKNAEQLRADRFEIIVRGIVFNRTILQFLEFYGGRLNHRGKWRIISWIRRVFHISLNEDRIVRRAGLLWKLNPANYVESDLFWFGRMDTWELYHARRFVQEGSVIFDIGANFGFYSCLLAHGLRSKCEVYSFEPFPETYARLQENVRRNHLEDCVRAFPIGLSDVSGHVSMSGVHGNSGAAHITPKKGDITLLTLDQVCVDCAITRIDFIKLDVEGFEVFVLRGGAKTIQRYKPVILVEMNPPTLQRAGVACKELSETLERYGYCLYFANKKKLVPLTVLPKLGDDYIDVFCIHSSLAGKYGAKN